MKFKGDITITDSKIELRLSDVEPPEPEPKRTIYRDIVNLPDPVNLGLTIRYFNHDDVDLYMQITGSCAGYTFGTVNLGLLGTGANAYQNLDEFASRAKPSVGDLPDGEMEENITLTLKAYTDAGYSELKWTFERVVTVHWINSADDAFTVDELDNFDDGTVQGWAVANEEGNDAAYPQLHVVSDYVLSALYSIRMTQLSSAAATRVRGRLYKSFTTPDKDVVYAIINFRLSRVTTPNDWNRIKNFRVQKNTDLLIFLGRPYDAEGFVADYVPRDKWMRVVVPLPKNISVEVRLVLEFFGYAALVYYSYLWIDDFKIISK